METAGSIWQFQLWNIFSRLPLNVDLSIINDMYGNQFVGGFRQK